MKILDTDILTLLAAGNSKVNSHARTETDIVVTTIISRIETLRGRFDSLVKAADAQQLEVAQQRLSSAERFLAKFMILLIDSVASAQFDRLRKQKKLRKIGNADLLIASIALANRATLVTRNVRHFQQITGLNIENWAD